MQLIDESNFERSHDCFPGAGCTTCPIELYARKVAPDNTRSSHVQLACEELGINYEINEKCHALMKHHNEKVIKLKKIMYKWKSK
jgi:hypothetical protein